jgi:hypothetical protein
MRRWATAVVVGGIVLLALLAAADAFRGSDQESGASPTASTIHPRGKPTLTGTLRRDQISGQLIYSDPLCALKVILLPNLHRDRVLAENGAQLTGCSFSYAAGHFLEGNVTTTRGDGATIARCEGQRVVVRNVVTKSVLERTTGCPVAWRPFPDGRSQLTRFAGGAIRADHTVLVSHAMLVDAARHHPNLTGLDPSIPLHVRVPEFAWPDEHKVIAVLEASAPEIQPERMLALIDGGNVTGLSTLFGGLIRHVVVSPNGGYAAVEPGILMRIDGRSWALPRTLGILHVFTFSPDARWLAVGTRASVFLVSVDDIERNEPSPRIARIPILATDLVWEPGGVTAGTKTAG